MDISLVHALVLSLLLVTIWCLRRPFLERSPLSAVPGPPSASLWKGMSPPIRFWFWNSTIFELLTHIYLLGNFSQIFDRITGWDFHRHLVETYGGAVKLRMLFGVSDSVLLLVFVHIDSLQDEQLYVSDPLALHHIIIKDQYAYEETAMFLTCVPYCAPFSRPT